MPLLPLALLLAQTTPPSPPPPRKIDCADADHRAFDFWIGDWDVSQTGDTTIIAHSRIEKVVNGCAIRETFDQQIGPGNTPIDYHGTSYSAYNAGDSHWRQFYVDTGGTAASLSGGIEGGAMIFTARAGSVTTRMTVRPQADGSVRQIGETSRDDGATWSPGYDFTYRRHRPLE